MPRLKTHTSNKNRLILFPHKTEHRELPFLLWMIRCIFVYIWAFPNTCMGIPFIFPGMLRGGQIRWVSGVLEISSPLIAGFLRNWIPVMGGASAMTLGHIVIGRDPECLDSARIHERVHVRQCEKWGPFFMPGYFAASFIAYCKGRDPYMGNVFEREAYEKEARERDSREFMN